MTAFRPAGPGDVETIAALHVRSWREHYRGAYSDTFLDGEASADRIAVWTERLRRANPQGFTIVAEVDGAVVGFAYVIVDEDPTLGAVLQNLHVKSEAQRHGVGSGLVAEVARTVGERRPGSGLHVWVREENAPARAFYEARGGTLAGKKLGGPFADGSRGPVVCYAWAVAGDDGHTGIGRLG